MHIRLKTLLLLVSPLLLVVAAAYIQWGTVGLPQVSIGLAVKFCNGHRALRLSGLAAHHPLRQLSVPDPAHPQRPANPRGSSPAVLERPLHARHRVAPAHAGRGAQRPRLDGKRRLPSPLSLDWPARLPAHRRHGAALALPERACSGWATAWSSWCCYLAQASGSAWCRPPGRSCPTPGPSSSTTPLSICHRSQTASTTTTRCSSSRTSVSCSSWPPWRC